VLHKLWPVWLCHNVNLQAQGETYHPMHGSAHRTMHCHIYFTIGWALQFWRQLIFDRGEAQYVTIGLQSYSFGSFTSLLFYSFSTSVFDLVHSCQTVFLNLQRILYIVFYNIMIFPFIYHWAWSSSGWASPYGIYEEALLAGCRSS
jgi:hypothetical protein